MNTPNNPVGRLVRLFDEAHKITNAGSTKAITVWAQLLGVEPGDRTALLRRLGQVLELPAQAEAAVRAIPGIEHGRLLTWVPKVEAAFKILNLDGTFGSFINPIDDTTLTALWVCQEKVSEKWDEPVADEDALTALLKEVRELRREIVAESDDLGDYLRDYMLHHLDLIEQAIGDYRIMGIVALGRAFQASIGAVVTEPAIFRQSVESSKGKAFIKVLGTYVVAIAAISQTLRLPADIKAFLTSDEPERLLEPKTDSVAPELSSVVEDSGQKKSPSAP